MKSTRGGLLFLASGGMELSWLYAWATFIMTSILHRPFPLPEAIGTFALAALLTIVVQGRGWWVILILGLQVFGLLLTTSRILHVFFYGSRPFFDQWWLLECFRQPKDHLEWFILVLILFFALLFWVGGVTLARRSTAYLTVCTRFDLGVAAFGCLLLIKFLLLVRGGIKVQDPMAELLLFPFFVFSLLAIGLARNRSSAQKDFLSGYQGIGVIVSFTVVVLAFGAGLVLLFLPYLTLAAEMGYGALKSAAGPLSPVLVSVLRFLFMPRQGRLVDTPASTMGTEVGLVAPGEGSWWTHLLEKIIGWGFLGLVGLIVAVISGLGIWYLFRWLLSRTPTRERGEGQWDQILAWAQSLRAMLLLLWGKILGRVRSYRGAVQLYAALLRWGRYSGVPHFLSETPAEYGLRLRHQFPAVKREIELIIEAFNQAVYGETVLSQQQLATAQLAWRRLLSPLHWSSRLRSWFLQRGDEGDRLQ
jgi:hypothetical protein